MKLRSRGPEWKRLTAVLARIWVAGGRQEGRLPFAGRIGYCPGMRMREQGKQYQRGDDGTMSVSRLVRRMKNVLEIEIGDVWVEGEVSNLRKQASGHYYFSLKDGQAQLGLMPTVTSPSDSVATLRASPMTE